MPILRTKCLPNSRLLFAPLLPCSLAPLLPSLRQPHRHGQRADLSGINPNPLACASGWYRVPLAHALSSSLPYHFYLPLSTSVFSPPRRQEDAVWPTDPDLCVLVPLREILSHSQTTTRAHFVLFAPLGISQVRRPQRTQCCTVSNFVDFPPLF